jgi:hypothetical protein
MKNLKKAVRFFFNLTSTSLTQKEAQKPKGISAL